MSYYTKKIPHKQFYDTFILAFTDKVKEAMAKSDTSMYCHVPADILLEVAKYCECHEWELQLSHLTEGQAFYKVSWRF